MEGSREIGLFWEKIRNSVDEIVGCLEGFDSESLNWRPLDDDNSLDVLATHTMGNLRNNLLNVLCGLSVARPGLARYSHGGESGPQPPSAFGISPRQAGGEGKWRLCASLPGARASECGPEQGWVTEVWTGASCHYAGGHGGRRS